MRFSEFIEEWEENYISEVISSKSKKYNPETNDVNYHSIELESLSQDSGELLSTFDSKNQKSIKNVFTSGDVLFGKLRPYLKKYYLANFDGVCSSEIWVLKSSILESSYLYAFIQSNSFISLTEISSGSKMPRADWNLVSSSVISYPSNSDERKKMGEIIQLINARIATQKKIISHLETLMKNSQENIFNQKLKLKKENGNNFPEWKIIKLGDLLIESKEKSKEKNQYRIISSTAKGLFYQDDYFTRDIASQDNTGYKILKKNQLVFSPQNLWLGNINVKSDFEVGLVSPSYKIFNFDEILTSAYFCKYYLKTSAMLFEFGQSSIQGASVVRRNLDLNIFFNIQIQIPSIDEQTKIANFLSAIAEKIEIEKKILAQYETQKKYLLANLFI